MYVLNLADHNRSSIDYEFYKYPDGQQQINLKGLKVIIGEEGFPENFDKEPIIIKSRLNGFMDLERILLAVTALRNMGTKEIHLYVPYFLGLLS